jgi:hypothetical protein
MSEWVLVVGIDGTNKGIMAICVAKNGLENGSSGDHNLDPSTFRRLPPWIGDVTHLQHLFERKVLDYQVIYNYSSYKVINISIMEFYEIDRLRKLISDEIYNKLNEIGVTLSVNKGDDNGRYY